MLTPTLLSPTRISSPNHGRMIPKAHSIAAGIVTMVNVLTKRVSLIELFYDLVSST